MVRIMKKDGNRLEGIGERIAVRLTLLEEALGMTPRRPRDLRQLDCLEGPRAGERR